jgi:hypothetical protein
MRLPPWIFQLHIPDLTEKNNCLPGIFVWKALDAGVDEDMLSSDSTGN